MPQKNNRNWITIYDRQNHRMLYLAGPKAGGTYWAPIKHDPTISLPAIYDIWRIEGGGDIVFIEVQLDDKDQPRGFPRDLLDFNPQISPTIWCGSDSLSAIWWDKR